MTWLWVAVKGILAGIGAFLWIALWYERSPWLGIAQAVIIECGLVLELRPNLGRSRR